MSISPSTPLHAVPVIGGRAVAERRMVMSYAPVEARRGFEALLALDDRLAAILRSTRDPMVGQMRLTWWHEALTALDTRAPPAEPVLQALARHVLPRASGGMLAEWIVGWEELLDPDPIEDARLSRFAEGRGAALFITAGAILGAGADDPLARAGRGWALADLAAHVGDERTRARAAAMAADDLAAAARCRWTARARALGAMTHLARLGPDAGMMRVVRPLWHRLTGR